MDVRVPIGGLLSILGLLIGGYGLATASDPSLYAKSLQVNVNLSWGAFMLVFGLLVLWLARRGRDST
jgi:branched-subunit amino acid ABC-type transport system permease component